jgi:hypothetical protein
LKPNSLSLSATLPQTPFLKIVFIISLVWEQHFSLLSGVNNGATQLLEAHDLHHKHAFKNLLGTKTIAYYIEEMTVVPPD